MTAFVEAEAEVEVDDEPEVPVVARAVAALTMLGCGSHLAGYTRVRPSRLLRISETFQDERPSIASNWVREPENRLNCLGVERRFSCSKPARTIASS